MQLVISRMSETGSLPHSLSTLYLHSMDANTRTDKVPNVLRFPKHLPKWVSSKALVCLAFGVSLHSQDYCPDPRSHLPLGWMTKGVSWKTQSSLDAQEYHLHHTLCGGHPLSVSTSLLTCISEALNGYTRWTQQSWILDMIDHFGLVSNNEYSTWSL